MTTISFFERLRRCAREWRTANGANVTITFALATIPIVGFVGAAVDYSRANSVKAAMQAAADSTALMLSKDAAGLTTAQIQTKANDYFKALFNRPEANGLTIHATYSTSGGNQLKIDATSNVKTDFMNLMGFSSLKIGVDSQVKWGSARLRVALVLDTTGSMQDDGKMDALKPATKALLDQLKAVAATPGDVYVSIIPFSRDVNVDKANYKATWIDWTDWDNNNGNCTGGGGGWGGGWGGGGSSYNTKSSCVAAGKTWNPDNHNTWNGCVTDRGDSGAPNIGNYDTNVTAPSISNKPTLFSAEQYDSCSPKVMALNYDWTGMKNLVDSFYPNGMTNQGIGLAHGWMSLVGGGPYPAPPAEDPNYKYQKIIILMSDGLNTQNRWYSSASQIDARQKMTCDNVKAAGITMYTIHVNTDGDPLSTLLKGCASSADKFWMLTSANALATTFQQIGTQLSKLRISQ